MAIDAFNYFSIFALILSSALVSTNVLADGSRDYRFSPPARAFAFRPALAVTSEARAVALQADRKIIIAGTCDDLFCVGRLSTTGELDASFSGPGNAASGVFRIQVGSSFTVSASNATSLAIQSDGKIVLAGYCVESSVRYACLARLNADGTLDSTFDGPNDNGLGGGVGNGRGAFLLKRATVSLDHPTSNGALVNYLPARGVAMSIQPDGKILIGHSCVGTSSYFCFARLNNDGSFDASFDGPSGTGNGAFPISVAGTQSYLTELTVQPSDGKILALGTCAMNASNDTAFCLTRLMPGDGAFDLRFDGGDNISTGTGDGRISVAVGAQNSFATGLAFTPDGYILIAGTCTTNTRLDFCAGQLDGGAGRYITFSGTGFPAITPVSIGVKSVATGIAVQSDGSFVLTGSCDNDAGIRQFCASRFHRNGVIDASYQGDENVRDGKFLIPSILTDDFAYAQAIQWNDMSVVVGRCQLGNIRMFCVTRLMNAFDEYDRPARTCDLDIDGDGKILPTVDGLILTRIMLGFNDSSILRGITINSSAARRDWAGIRRHLATRCGLQFLRLD